ncbi:MAG TPA: type VI secretion system contractile sheath small subunit [Steroidobacteraceae bacterium]|nr:type VI secretion system contractile sheath small subunit [Steroidobacteraceae bacterium]
MANIYDKLERQRRPRVHIKYEIETGGATVERELPFVVGVMGDFSGNPTQAMRPLKDRKFIQIDKENFNDVMERIAPELNIKVKNTLAGDDSEIPVQLKFRSMEDFEPGQIAEQVPALKKLMETRNQLRDLMTKVDRSQDLENILERVLQNESELKTLSSQLGTDKPKE